MGLPGVGAGADDAQAVPLFLYMIQYPRNIFAAKIPRGSGPVPPLPVLSRQSQKILQPVAVHKPNRKRGVARSGRRLRRIWTSPLCCARLSEKA